MHPWYGMRTSMHQWYGMGGGMHLWYGMRGSMHHSHLLLQLRGHIPVCIRTGACACNKVHFYNCICGNAAHFDLSNISSTADRQTQNQVLVQVMSGNIIEVGLFKHYIEQSPIISLEKFQNNQRSKHFQKSVFGPQRSLVGVQSSSVLPGHL